VEEVEMRLNTNKRLTELNEGCNKQNGVQVQIADPNLIIKKQPLKKRMDRHPKPLLEKSSKTTISPARGSG